MASTVTQRRNATKNGEDKTPTTTNNHNDNDLKKTKKSTKATNGWVDLLGGIGGLVDFSLFQAPKWVDLNQPPGFTSQEPMYMENPQLLPIITGHYIIFSPNLVWLVMAIGMYVGDPYDFEAARQTGFFQTDWFLHRARLNVTVMLAYYGFWHIVLYGLHLTKRPFAQGRIYRLSKLCHNAWYCFLGTIQWTAWEMIMVHLYATGRIGYQRDDEVVASWKNVANFLACAIIVPVFRECQFFFAHRLIHIRCFYKYIHSLHHRNTDIEPFSGLCMSPAEHLYYFSSTMPSFYWHASPFQFLWNGLHAVISPGASHSGWEDHWHCDQFHYGHHRYFECNYGTPGLPLDRWFGTFRETLAQQTKSYHGVAEECVSQTSPSSSKDDNVIVARADAKSTLLKLPTWDHFVYMMATALGLPVFVARAVQYRDDSSRPIPFFFQANIAALVVAAGPLALAALLSAVTANPPINSWEKFRYTMFYPFHKDSLFGKFGLTLLLGAFFSTMPVYHMFHSLLVQDPQDTIYNRLWNGNNFS